MRNWAWITVYCPERLKSPQIVRLVSYRRYSPISYICLIPNVLQLPEGRDLENKIINLKTKLC
jgi:hypothetical protein